MTIVPTPIFRGHLLETGNPHPKTPIMAHPVPPVHGPLVIFSGLFLFGVSLPQSSR
ncbi:MAG: hypothetical protein IKW74_01240 [Thermoguttaceae bacterium]|nr:hypothetical protein [Thermoguttaceae bacterium]